MGYHVHSMTHIHVAGSTLRRLTLSKTDVTAVPSEQSIICAVDWEAMCKVSGGERELMVALRVTEVSDVG